MDYLEKNYSDIEKNENYVGGEYIAFFPTFYPDGDYYFFIDDEYKNGYLGHPWRQEVLIFGNKLIEEIRKIADELGWEKIR